MSEDESKEVIINFHLYHDKLYFDRMMQNLIILKIAFNLFETSLNFSPSEPLLIPQRRPI